MLLHLKSKIMAFSLFALPLLALAGGSDGGGNVFESSEKEVRDAIKEVKFNLNKTLDFDGRVDLNLSPAITNDPALKSILNRLAKKNSQGIILEGQNFLSNEVKNYPKLIPQLKCVDEYGRTVAGRTEFGRPGAPIYINISAFMKLGPAEMRLQIAALLVHEISHHAQPKPQNEEERKEYEKEARHLQAYFLQNYRSDFTFVENTHEFNGPQVLFPGGTAKIQVDIGKYVIVGCGHRENNKYPLGTVLVEPGSSPMFVAGRYGSGGDTTKENFGYHVVCRNLPALDCQVSPATNSLVVGGVQIERVLKDLSPWREWGICKKSGASPDSSGRRGESVGESGTEQPAN